MKKDAFKFFKPSLPVLMFGTSVTQVYFSAVAWQQDVVSDVRGEGAKQCHGKKLYQHFPSNFVIFEIKLVSLY